MFKGFQSRYGFVGLFFCLVISASAFAKVPEGFEPYSVRPDILTVSPSAEEDLPPSWRDLLRGHLEAVAQLIELYPDHELYFLARDAELLYDFARLIGRDDPSVQNRIHLINVSRANMRANHVKKYLEQEGLSAEEFSKGKKVLLVDTGFAGTIPETIRSYFPNIPPDQLQVQLLVSSNKSHPSTRVFLHPINPAVANGFPPSKLQGSIVSYEHMPRYTDRSTSFALLDNRWEAVSPIRDSADRTVNKELHEKYQRSLVDYYENNGVKALLNDRRNLYRNLYHLADQLEEVSRAITELSSLSKLSNHEGNSGLWTDPYLKSLVRDFLEIQRLNYDRLKELDPTEFGLEADKVDRYQVNKLDLAIKHPQWKHILEDPETEIKQLVAKEDFGTLGALLDVLADKEINQLISLAFGEIENPSSKHVTFVKAMINKADTSLSQQIVTNILPQAQWSNYPHLVERLLEQGTVDDFVVMDILSVSYWANHPHLVETLIERGAFLHLVALALSKPHWTAHPHLVELLIEKGDVDKEIATLVLSRPYWADHPQWVELLIEREAADREIAKYVLSQPHWANYPQWVETLLEKGSEDADIAIAHYVLSQPHWAGYPQWVELLLNKGTVDNDIAMSALTKPHWAAYPQLIELLIENGTATEHTTTVALSTAHWKEHPDFLAALNGKPVTVDNLRELFNTGFTFMSQGSGPIQCSSLFQSAIAAP